MLKSSKPTIYLAGKMSGLTYEQMISWRVKAANMLDGFIIYDPAAMPAFIDCLCQNEFASAHEPTSREIVDSNKFFILNSDVVLAEIDYKEISIGTIGEIVFARLHNKPVIVWGSANEIIYHPWIQEHITVSFANLKDSCEYIRGNYHK